MSLVRTILGLVIIVILFHMGASYIGVEQGTNGLTRAVYGLGELLESPAEALILWLPLSEQQQSIVNSESGFYVIALTAAGGYLILYLLLGVGKRR